MHNFQQVIGGSQERRWWDGRGGEGFRDVGGKVVGRDSKAGSSKAEPTTTSGRTLQKYDGNFGCNFRYLFFKCTFVNYRHSLTKFLRMIDRVFFVETKQSQPAMLAHNGLQLLQIINEAESILFWGPCLHYFYLFPKHLILFWEKMSSRYWYFFFFFFFFSHVGSSVTCS